MSVTVNAGPSFTLTDSGRLMEFTVYSPQGGQRIAGPHSDVALVAWQIRALSDYSRVEESRFMYGKVPADYRQVVPNPSQTAPPLPTGAVYSFFALPADSRPVGGYFYLGKTGPIQIRVPDLCLTLIKSREVRVKCGTTEPYQEPSNLEEMVQRNRIGSPDNVR
jgi:hypothetical protein